MTPSTPYWDSPRSPSPASACRSPPCRTSSSTRSSPRGPERRPASTLFADGGARRCLVPTMRAATSGRGRAWADLEAARQTLAEHPDCTGRVGVIGFCMGGSFALVAAGRGAFDAASVNYGLLPEDAERALAESCPVVASYGGRDRMLKGAAARLESVLEGAGVPHDVKEYPGAGHSFLNDAENAPRLLRPLTRISGIGPEPESAADAWRRIEGFFAEHLAGS
ncbi:dienelactone hydrolase family protein [Streptomyces sp. NBC_00481]|uniref:dienelactone hydrolase family protein n=1 Tax=Streptomyces sp. NBC_00481 TaxID=2975755 RepID=UPI002DDC036A|nr:dienelactone hydrolase family protein [Streptomyces sp. NBC_00481]